MSHAAQMMRLIGRPRLLILGALAAAIALVVLLTSQGKAGAQVTYADYPALDSSSSSGIIVVNSPSQADAANGPVWVVEGSGQAASRGVDIGSAREVETGVAGLRLWIAKGTNGGICVLTLVARPMRIGPSGPGASCSAASRLASGAVAVLYGSASGTAPSFIAGVVPRGVSSVEVQLAGNATDTLTVHSDAYAAPITTAVEGVSFKDAGSQQQINLGGA